MKDPIPTAKELEKELRDSFYRWDHLYKYGGQDPFWSDGSNMHLVRNHIMIAKSNIEKALKPEEYPEIYYRETPEEIDRDYMARPDEIRVNARKSLEIYLNDPDFQYLVQRVKTLNQREIKETSILNVIGYATGLKRYIEEDDLIAMRRHEHAERYIESFRRCAEEIRSLKPRIGEQIEMII